MKKSILILSLLIALLPGTQAWAENGILAGEGTCVNPYIINDVADWDYFTTLLNDPIYSIYYADKHFKLGNDIGYYNSPLDNQYATTTAAINPDHPFRGNFNGNGHTIWIKWDHSAQNFTPDPNDESSQGIALFKYADDGCQIHDLTVRGNIWTSFKYAAGFISYIKGEDGQHKYVTLSRCRSCITIMSYVEGEAISAGLVGFAGDYVYLNIIDCLFDGTFSSGDGTHFSGMVGYQMPYGHTYFENSLVKPYNVYLISSEGCYTFCAYDENINYAHPCVQCSNSYYMASIGKKQGTYISGTTNPETVALRMGNWKVVGDQALPITIADVAPNCMLFSGFNVESYNIPHNTIDNDGQVGYRMVADGNRGTQWKIHYTYGTCDHWMPISVDFSCDMRFIPKGYILTTGKDLYDNDDYNPESWNLYGYSETYQDWILLDSRDADEHSHDALPKVNVADKMYECKENLAVCQKFRLEITNICRPETVHSGIHPWATNTDDFEFELGEIKIFGVFQGMDLYKMSNCSVGGLMPCYAYTGEPIAINYAVTNHNGDKLIKNYHYTDSLVRRFGDIVEQVTEVNQSGEYELVLKGMGTYNGLKSRYFVVGGLDLPLPMIYEKDEQLENSFYYCVKMPNSGQIDLDLTSTDPDFVQQFYIFDDGGKYGIHSSYYDSKLLIKAPEGYLLQVSGSVDFTSGYPNDYLELYDGDTTTSPILGSYHYDGSIEAVVSSGHDLLVYFKSGSNSYANGLNLLVKPISLAETHDIAITSAEHGSITATPASDVTAKTPVTLDINPDNGYLIQDLTVTAGGIPVQFDGGLWYSGSPLEASFEMPVDDVTVTPTFAETYALSVDMPKRINSVSEAMVAYIPANVNVFKVHSTPTGFDGYTYSYLRLVAPEGRMLQISGIIDDLDGDELEVYNGSSTSQKLGYVDENHHDLGMLISTGNEVLLKFYTELYGYYGYFELTVNVIDHNTDDYNIVLANPTEGGTISINGSTEPTTAHALETVTLEIAPASGYLLKDLIVSHTVGGNTYYVSVRGGMWHDTDPTKATFVMPANDVTITPYFTNDLTAEGGLYVNMSAYGSFDSRKIVVVPDQVTSFKIYDDGGKDGNYSRYCSSYLELRVSENYRINLSGTVTCSYNINDLLRLSEGYEYPYITLGSVDGYGNPEGEEFNMLSNGTNMILYFNTEFHDTYSGLDLRMDRDDTYYPYAVNLHNLNGASGCYITVDAHAPYANQVVTMTLHITDNYLLQELSVIDADGNDVALSQGMCWYDGNNTTATFTMPGRDVTITYSFVEKGNQYVKMPKKNTVDTPLEVTFPEGITSCKVYDDGGAEAHYSDYCNAYTLFTAPEGKVWKLTGIVKSEHGSDYMVPYDGNNTTQLIDFYYYGKHTGDGEDIGGLVTFSNQMLIRFYSDYLVNYDGLDLTAEMIDPLTRTIEGYAGAPAGQERWAFIAAPMKYYTLPEDVVNLIPLTNGVPDPTSPQFDLYRFNQSAELEWENYKDQIDDFSLDAGQGYLYANASTKTLQFGGAVNNKDSKSIVLDYDANAGFKGLNLVGNPLLTDAYVNRPYYKMDEFGSNIVAVEHYRLERVPAFTGIMVMAEDEHDTITFSKDMPPFEHRGALLISVSGHDKAIVSFNEGTRLRKYVFNKNNASLHIQQDGSDYAIAYSEKQGEVPLGFKAVEDGDYVINVIPENVHTEYLHLIDQKTGADIDLLAENQYSFYASTTDDESRFRLEFSVNGVEENENDNENENFAYINNGEIILTGVDACDASLQVIDMLGRILLTQTVTPNSSLPTPNSPGVYVLRLINGENVMTQKIVIE